MTHMMTEILSQPKVIENLIQKNKDAAKKIADEMKKRDIQLIYIAARGTSDHAAIYAKYVLEAYAGIPVALAAPSVISLYHGDLKLKNAMVMGISQSGKALDALEVLKHAKKQNAMTVSATNDVSSPMAKQADFHIDCLADQEISVAATKTFTSTLVNMALIAWAYTEKESLLEYIEQIPQLFSQYFEHYGLSKETISTFKNVEECFVLARGTMYPLALECALKIQETCYIRAKGYATSDFYHGPLAMIQKGYPVILLAPKGKTQKDTKKMIDRLHEIGARLTIFSDCMEFKEKADHFIQMPESVDDLITPIVYAGAIQQFACMLSLERGLDPDKPRNLKKVTLTK